MSWIEIVPPVAATGALGELYAAIERARGGVAEVHRVQSLHPRALKAHLELYQAVVLARSSLSRVDRERIAVVVSAANGCAYCVAHHAEALRRLHDTPSVVDALAAGEVPAGLPVGEAALLRWARRGALEPAQATARDLDELRGAGLDDRAILDAALTVAYFSFVNRLVLLLGVELEAGYEATCGTAGEPAT